MSNLNCSIIEGHLVRAAESSYFRDGTPYCNFSIANNESYKKQDGTWENIPSYFDCTMKGKYAEVMAKHLLKGRGVRVVGRLKQQRWEKDGQKFSRVVIKVQELYLSPLQNNENSGNYQQNYQQNHAPEKVPQEFNADFNFEPEFVMPEGEDIPF